MSEMLDDALDVLREYGIDPDEDELPDMPEVGTIESDETIYTTSLDSVYDTEIEFPEDPRLKEFRRLLEEIKEGRKQVPWTEFGEASEPSCAWYCPIHYFGHGWGIYIRERCILRTALDVARYVNWPSVTNLQLSSADIYRQLWRSAFYAYFLHEQFHHKVESLGFRLLVATGTDRYRPYKLNVYRQTYLTSNCLEESLANAESYLRVTEERYKKRQNLPFRNALQSLMKASFSIQPPGYREALSYLTDATFRSGQNKLHSAMLDGLYPPKTPSGRWVVAPHMIRALMSIDAEIYVILPSGAKPLFKPTSIDPGVTISTDQAKKALIRKYGYAEVSGGKGSHVKLIKAGAKPIVLRGKQAALSPGLLKHVLAQLGDYPLSRAREIL
jgi:hypothetical protein